MTYGIDPNSTKALTAIRFGQAMLGAMRRRKTTLTEIARVSGLGRTAVDNYRVGYVLPRLDAARKIADALGDDRLYEMVRAARTHKCGLRSCGREFVHNGGGPKVYHSPQCRMVAEKLRLADTRARRAAEGDDTGKQLRAAKDLWQEAERMLTAQVDEHRDAVDRMCRQCEPEGVCQTYDCPLRSVSPLPLNDRRIGAGDDGDRVRTRGEIWAELAARPEIRVKRSASMTARHAADPTLRERSLGAYRALEAANPELAKTRGQKAIAGRTPESFSEASHKAWATRRAQQGEEAAP